MVMKTVENKSALSYFKSVEEALGGDLLSLKTYLGISEFGYMKILPDNKFFYFSSDPEMIDDYVKYVQDTIIFYNQTLSIQSGYYVITWPELQTMHYSMELYKKHNHYNGVTLLKKNNDSIEMHWFTSDNQTTLDKCLYTKNSKILTAFVQHWLDKNKTILNFSSPKILATFNGSVDLSNIEKMELEVSDEKSKLKQFLEIIRSGGTTIHTQTANAHITPRELECLSLLVKGNTAKEAANLLNLSIRTIEGHINNIRSKVGFLYKSDLIKLYREQIIDFDF